jgi:cytochrome c oxidase assembly protein subunit 15
MQGTEQALVDLAPLARLLLLALVLAALPLAWWWLRARSADISGRIAALTALTLFLTFDLIVFGSFTRLSDSGLGCPDWPGCYGSASPIGAREEITQAQTALPTGPVTHGKAWIEMIHRYLASAVGVLIVTLAAATFWLSRRRETGQGAAPLHVSPAWPLLTLFWVCMQGAFGALTVTMKLFPAIVTLHLLGGMALLALLQAQASRYAQADAALAEPTPVSASARLLLWLGFALLWLQIALGGWVSTNYAVLACTEFPGCQGSFWPTMDFRQGFTLWRELGAGRDGGNISFAALTAIHYVHRLAAYGVMLVLLLLALKLRREPATQQAGRWVLGLIVWQFASGLSNVVLGWPLLAALAHTAGAAALVIVLTATICNTRTAARARSIVPLSQASA